MAPRSFLQNDSMLQLRRTTGPQGKSMHVMSLYIVDASACIKRITGLKTHISGHLDDGILKFSGMAPPPAGAAHEVLVVLVVQLKACSTSHAITNTNRKKSVCPYTPPARCWLEAAWATHVSLIGVMPATRPATRQP